MTDFIKKTFSDDAGQPSMMRVVQLFTTLGVLLVWTWTSIKAGVMADFPPEMVVLILGTNGAKAYQKRKEGTEKNEK